MSDLRCRMCGVVSCSSRYHIIRGAVISSVVPFHARDHSAFDLSENLSADGDTRSRHIEERSRRSMLIISLITKGFGLYCDQRTKRTRDVCSSIRSRTTRVRPAAASGHERIAAASAIGMAVWQARGGARRRRRSCES